MNYLIFGVFIVTLIFLNLEFIQKVISKNIHIDLIVVAILVLAKLFELSTGLSNLVLGYSKKWKLENIISVANVIVAIPLNIILVKQFGILGAAWCTLILAVVTFSIRLIILKKTYGLFPFKWSTLTFSGISLILFILFYLLCKQFDSIYMHMLWSSVFAILFLSIVIIFRFSEDINSVFQAIKIRARSRFP